MSEPVRIGDLSVAEIIIDMTENPPDEDYRQMVIYELMRRCGEPIDGDAISAFSVRMKDRYEKKILAFPKRKLPWPEYIS